MLLKYISTKGQHQPKTGRALLLTLIAAAAAGFTTFTLAAATPLQVPATNSTALTTIAPTASTQERYANETAIRFTAGNGDSIAAFSGFFLVPENRQRANSRLLKLHYVRFPAQTKEPGSPVVYLAGGPGGSGIHTAKGPRYPLFTGLSQHADVIALDQRGTGLSADMPPCRSAVVVSPDQPIDEAKFAAQHRQAALECSKFWQQQGADVLGYTTVQNALDLDALRQHLGAEKLTLWGISYGTHLALAASKLIPERLDKLILASVEGLDQTVKLPSETHLYLQRLQQLINLNPKLKQSWPDINRMMQQVLAQLEQKPVTLRLKQADGTNRTFLFQRLHLQLLTSMSLADPNQRMGQLLQLYQGLQTEQPETIAALTELIGSGLLDGYVAGPIELRLMPLMTDLASGISAKRQQLFQQQQNDALLGGMLNFPMPQLNGSIPELDLGDSFREESTQAIPTLVLSGTLDGRTYLAEQQQAVAGLSARQQVTVLYGGHNLLESSPQVLTLMQQFLNTGKVSQQQLELAVPDLGL